MNIFRIGFPELVVLAVAACMGACSSLPERIDTLEQARTTLRSLERDPLAREAASLELSEARQAIETADRAYEDSEDLELVEHYAYVADRHVRIAQQQIAEAHARDDLDRADAERNEVLLQAREREAERARALAERRARQAQLQAARAASAEQRAENLARELQSVQAENTERGMVLTLSDILFATDRASLNPGAATTLDELAAFLYEYPERRLFIEGHADARGPAAYNVDLSERRAQAVQAALVERGIAQHRLEIAGLGEEYPVASNQTSAGMQQNRRVEIVLSDADGEFPVAVGERTASSS